MMLLSNSQRLLISLLIGGFITLIGLFNINTATSSDETVRISGADIACSSENVGQKTSCVGQYSRGWPVAVVNGAVVVRDDGQINAQTDFKPAKALYNVLLISLIAYVTLALYERSAKS